MDTNYVVALHLQMVIGMFVEREGQRGREEEGGEHEIDYRRWGGSDRQKIG